ncbi:alpha-ketoglutarate-dependent dioxygenase AlkB [Modestobacter sp. VKM Ac-2984]|uniref:alpha-ketoglutarate-dependent dioxygenase AlkB n=1 Tax=Modestobacter sp. VKM Ac-2984 TaxID=3004138 RepID=UPI0022AA2C3C|nr:alpha-ketoglutarate-dependent dioxygenase AlkB [Modestobacter sp. VKM Ac-2984]MCZ2815229.1 alpha-ketoglutarate-dependent dioxygenase AlkB [Modestobacter sp. VKM Ac-2984]
MSLAHQPSIWDVAEEAALTPLAGRVSRHLLSRGAWVDHLTGWVVGSDSVLDVLLGDIGWREDRRQMYEREVAVPRLLRWYGAGEALPHALLTEARTALDAHYRPELGEPFVTAGMCLYRDGRDSVAWHGDRIGRSRTEDTLVAIVSFGSPRPLLLRPVGGGESRRFTLGHGDLVVMGGSCQRSWEHCIPKTTKPVGPRVSVQFRPRGVA